MQPVRKIIHIDMDAFYASVEQRDRPELKGKPVIVGGDPQSRGVVAACSYEARKFGIHSAMASSTAYKLCPDAVFIRARFDAYRAVSADIRKIFCEYTDLVEPLSLDEAFLDVTENYMGMPSATLIAQEIKKKIYSRTGKLTASAGVSFNKFIAKVASDINKPDGITVITPDIRWFLENELWCGPESCDEILYEIKRIESGAIPCVEIDGNQNVLWIDAFNVKISNHYFKPPKVTTLPLNEFKIIIEKWRTFLSTPTNERPVEKA